MALDLIVTNTTDESDRIRIISLAAAGGETLPDYTAGSHLTFDLGDVGERSYSLVNWPGESDGYRIAVQREDDGQGGSRAMHMLDSGAKVSASDPKNDFELHNDDAPALLLAGGIGITPVISFATELTRKSAPFHFHYATRSTDTCAFKGQLEQSFGTNLSLWFDDTNQINLKEIVARASADTHIYCCGPKGMIEAVRELAEAAEFPKDQIHFELFSSPATHEGDQPFEVEISDSGQVFTIPADKTIIEVLEEAGVDVMYDCARGDCGICQTDVISGTPDHRDVVLSESEHASGKVMQICVSRSKSPRLVLDI